VDRLTRRADRARAVRVVFVGEHEIIAAGLKAMLAPHRDRVELVGDFPGTEDLVTVATELSADVVLLELPPHTDSRLEPVIEELPCRVVIFADDADEGRVYKALRRGASGYLLTSLSGTQLADHLVRARNGEVVMDPTLATRTDLGAAHDGNGQVPAGRQLGLSNRESEVLGLLAEGLSNRLIAAELVLGEETVKTHLRNIYRKLEVKDRAQAVAIAIRQGIVS
jgi:DNA-binding NarL/FixJ family response regulator